MPLLASPASSLEVKYRLYSARVHSVMLHRSEAWLVKEENLIRLEWNVARMARWMFIVRPADRISAEELRTRLKLKSMRRYLQDTTLNWFGHLEKNGREYLV